MRIAMLSWESLHSIAVGGVSSHVTELAAVLNRKGHDVHVFTRMAPGQPYHDVIDGVHYHRCPYAGHHDFVDDVNNMCRAFVDRVFVVEDMNGPFDVVHAHDWLAANAMIWIKQGRRRRSILTIHATEYARCGNTFPNGRSQRIRDQERAATYWADSVICVSQTTKNEVKWMYESPDWKTLVAYNGVSPHRFDAPVDAGEVKHRHGIGPMDPTILFAGRLEWQKGPDLLVEAIPAILRSHKNAKFVFAGDGGMRSQLENRARQLGVAHAVRFLGFRNNGDLVSLFKMSEGVCVPSRNEPFGIVVLEAWSACKPVVVSQNGGPGEYVWHEVNGLKIFPQVNSVVWGIERLFSDYDRARWMGQNGRLAVEQRFTWDLVAEQTLNIYDPARAKPAGSSAGSSAEALAKAEASARTEASAKTEAAAQAEAAATAGRPQEQKPAPVRVVLVAAKPAPAAPQEPPLKVRAKLSFGASGHGVVPPGAFAACQQVLAQSGLRVRLRRGNAIIEGDWEKISAVIRRCYLAVQNTGEPRFRTSISTVGASGDLRLPQAVPLPKELLEPLGVGGLRSPPLHMAGGTAKTRTACVG